MSPRVVIQVDVAIVGAGIGGCYVGYRLLDGMPGTSRRRGADSPVITLFEGSSRIGGRLWSIRAPLAPAVPMELGGMRFHRAEHYVNALIRHLGLHELVLPFEFWRPENIVYVRGARLRARQLRRVHASARVPFTLLQQERGLDADDLALAAIEAALPGFAQLRGQYHRAYATQDWAAAKDIHDRFLMMLDAPQAAGYRLPDVPWSDVLDTNLSPGAVRFLQSTDGYDGYHTNGNAASWINSTFRVPPAVKYKTLSGGMQSLPLALHTRFTSAGGKTFFQHELRRVDRLVLDNGAPAFELRFRVGGAAASHRPREVVVHARTVVLAVPQQAIEALDQKSFFLTPAVRAQIGAVQNVSAFKLFLVYPSPWWRRKGVQAGRSTTDLPLRQVWYLPGERSEAGLVMAAYPAGPSVRYWDAFRSGPRFEGSSPLSPASADETQPSAAMVGYAHSLLSEMHDVADAPDPLAASWHDWSGIPHGAAWHVWRPGYAPGDVASRLTQPIASSALYLVSDCWTESPGSVQGSLSAAESVLRRHLSCGVPRWMEREYTPTL